MSSLEALVAFVYSAAVVSVVATSLRDAPPAEIARRAFRLFLAFVGGIAGFSVLILVVSSLA